MIGEKSKIRSAFEEKHVQCFDQDGTVTLVEDEANNGLERALIHDVCAGSVLFGFHKASPIPSLIKENKNAGYHKKCDYALFTVVTGCPTVFFIEMKTTNFKEDEVICQLKSAACMVDYITGFARRFLDINQVAFQERFVVFCRSKEQDATKQNNHLPLPSRTRLPFASKRANTEPDNAILLLDPDIKSYSIQDLIRN